MRTGADGRFRVTGVGRDRVAFLIVEGGSIEQTFAIVSTTGDRDYKPVPLPSGDGSVSLKIQAPRFEMSVAPGRAFEGTVRDRDTGRPIAGASSNPGPRGPGSSRPTPRADSASPASPGAARTTSRSPWTTSPISRSSSRSSDQEVLDPARLDITLKRGVWVEGKVMNRATGKPVKAVVTYYPFRDNPGVKECPDASFLNNNVSDEVEFPTDAQGHFRAVALPGRGHPRRLGQGTGLRQRQAARLEDGRQRPAYRRLQLLHVSLPCARADRCARRQDPCRPRHHADAGPDAAHPDRRPRWPAGVRGHGSSASRASSLAGETINGDEWTFIHANPGKAESLIISHADRSLGATIDLKGDEPDPVRVVLQPCGTVTGRLVDEDGKPRPSVRLAINQRYMSRGDSTGTERMDGDQDRTRRPLPHQGPRPRIDLQRRGHQAERDELFVPGRGLLCTRTSGPSSPARHSTGATSRSSRIAPEDHHHDAPSTPPDVRRTNPQRLRAPPATPRRLLPWRRGGRRMGAQSAEDSRKVERKPGPRPSYS